MHDQAKLTAGTGAVGAVGSYVTIDDVEDVYSTSATANSAEAFECADPTCKVRVIAVITDSTKKGRRKSPSSYFRASPNAHVVGCTREPSGAASSTGKSPVTKSASPTKATAPTVWVDPSTTVVPPAIIVTPGVVPPLPLGGTGAGVSSSGSGIGSTSSRRVQKFAQAWLAQTPTQRTATAFVAPWNPAGTYDSAFFDLGAHKLTSRAPSAKHIFRGTVQSIFTGTSGYTLTLKERHGDGLELRVWVQSGMATSGPSGKSLWDRLSAGTIAVGSEVFALGVFHLENRPSISWHSLPIVHGNSIWIP